MSATGEPAGGVVAQEPPAADPAAGAPAGAADAQTRAAADQHATGDTDDAAPEACPACPRCGAASARGEQFCEACGSPLPAAGAPAATAPTGPTPDAAAAGDPAPGPCASCGGTIDADGYCQECGVRARPARDHVVSIPAPWVAGVSDRGRRHRRNEDAVAVGAVGEVALLVVCDGVTTAPNSDVASAAAVAAALEVLTGGVGDLHAGCEVDPGPEPSPDAETASDVTAPATGDTDQAEDGEDGATGAALLAVADAVLGGTDGTATAAAALLRRAADAAAVAVRATPAPEGEAASCTFVAAVVDGGRIVAGNVGDSRGYWLPDAGPAALLTLDDSWASELLSRGMPRAEAETAYGAHAITRWLGGDSPDTVPRCRELVATGPGWLLLCSDGLWNYCSEPGDLAALVAACAGALGADLTPEALAETLVSWANGRGGHDNITVALARLDPAVPSRQPSAAEPSTPESSTLEPSTLEPSTPDPSAGA